MSKATKVKHVQKEVLEEFSIPEEPQRIVKVISGRGNNLHEVETEAGERFLASMPTKFRKNVWVKRGDFVVVEPIEEGDKVKAEIIQILYKEQLKYIKAEGKFPVGFGGKIPEDNVPRDELFVNTNRVQVTYDESDDESTDEEEEDSECCQDSVGGSDEE